MLQIQRRLGITCLYVTHDQEEAMTLSDRMCGHARRSRRAGRDGRWRCTYHPGRHVRRLVRRQPKMNLVDGELTDESLDDGKRFRAVAVTNESAGDT